MYCHHYLSHLQLLGKEMLWTYCFHQTPVLFVRGNRVVLRSDRRRKKPQMAGTLRHSHYQDSSLPDRYPNLFHLGYYRYFHFHLHLHPHYPIHYY